MLAARYCPALCLVRLPDLEVAAHEGNDAEAFGVLGVDQRKAVHARSVVGATYPVQLARRTVPSNRLKADGICGALCERMMGLGPTTFCMASRGPVVVAVSRSRAGSVRR